MTRTGHPRARRGVRDHRITKIAAAVMLLLTLGASLLVSAGSPHHHRDTHVAVDTVAAAAHPDSHEHHRGNDWAPTLGKRLRPAATVAVSGVVAAEPDQAPQAAAEPAPPASRDELTARGILRI